MNYLARIAGCFVVGIYAASALYAGVPVEEVKTIAYSDLATGNVVVTGVFGLPLGSVFAVEGVLVRAKDTLGPLYNSSFLLAIDAVNGTKLKQPKRMFFEVKDVSTRLPEGLVEVEAWKREELKRPLTDDERREMLRQYEGKRYKLSVVENGYFSGVPKDLPANCVLWAEERYRFYTSLVVIAGGPP